VGSQGASHPAVALGPIQLQAPRHQVQRGLVAQAELGPGHLQPVPPPELVCIQPAQSISTTKWCPPNRGRGNTAPVNWTPKKAKKMPILWSAQSEKQVVLKSLSQNSSEVNALERNL